MRGTRPSLQDGVVTGCALSIVVYAVATVAGRTNVESSAWVCVVGVAVAFTSSLWTVIGDRSPPGLLGWLTGDGQAQPSAPPGSTWIDRFVSPRNVWLVAGFTMAVLSLVPLLLEG